MMTVAAAPGSFSLWMGDINFGCRHKGAEQAAAANDGRVLQETEACRQL
jgi:hypothetical protein